MIKNRGFSTILIVIAVALVLLLVVGVGVYLKSQDQTLGYKTQKSTIGTKSAKPTPKQLGLSSGNEITDIDADMKTVNFDGLDAYINEAASNIK